jgi:PAS domain S-box-containing protein
MDVSMPRLNGLDATREIKRIFADVEIVIVSQHEAPEMMRQAFNAGACGYVVKSSISEDLLTAIAKAKVREIFVKPSPTGNGHSNPDFQEILQRSAAYERALRESEERFRSAMNNLAEGLYTLDMNGCVTYVNPSAEKLLGWTATELIGKNIHEVAHYKYLDGAPFPKEDCPSLQVLRNGLELHEFEDTFIRKDGSFFPVVFSTSPMQMDGRPNGIVVSFRDDTKRRETEEALEQSERIYHAIGESIDYGVWICNAAGRNIYASNSFLKLIGLTQKEYSESGWANVLHEDDAQTTIDAWKACVRDGTFWQREHRFKRPGGGWHYILSRGAPIRDSYGKIQYWAGINLDIQQWKEAEVVLETRVAKRTEELLKARNELRGLSVRLLKAQDEERRRIARELHDGVGQLLAAMTMSVPKLLAEKRKLSDDASKVAEEVDSLIAEALRDIRTMSYLLHPPLLDEIGLAPALQWYLGGFSERSNIAVQLDIAPDLGKLSRDVELSLFRIVQECLTNIHRHSGSQTAEVTLCRTSKEVVLEVRDEGDGIPQDVAEKISSGDSFGLGIRGMRER